MAKIRCACANCGKIKYASLCRDELAEIHFLCPRCDSAYITWQHTNRAGAIYVDTFLRSAAAKRCRSPGN